MTLGGNMMHHTGDQNPAVHGAHGLAGEHIHHRGAPQEITEDEPYPAENKRDGVAEHHYKDENGQH